MSNNDSEISSSVTNSKMEKPQKNWFRSLSRRKKSSPNLKGIATASDTATATTEEDSFENTTREAESGITTATDGHSVPVVIAKDRNIFQRFKLKMVIRFSSRRHRKSASMPVISQSNEIESQLQSPSQVQPFEDEDTKIQQVVCMEPKQAQDEDPVNFTQYYRAYLTRKWLELPSEPNLVMYKASTEMLRHVWYWGELSRQDAQKQLTDKPNGSFLLRDSETQQNQFALSFRIGNFTLHYRLQSHEKYWHFEDLQYESIVEMIEDIMLRSTDELFVCYVKVPTMQPPIPVLLKYPVSRYSKIPTLQDLSRRLIQRHINSDSINALPIPVKLQHYLNEKITHIV